MKILALCHTCSHKHVIDFDPVVGPGSAFSDWLTKHPQHAIDFEWPGRTYKREVNLGRASGYLDNADIKVAYASSAAYTITLTSLASSATYVAGRESTAVSNTTNLYLDYLVGGVIRSGTTPTDNTSIRIYLYGSVNDTPTYPDVLDGTDSAETITDTELLGVAIPLFAETPVDTTTDQDYWFAPKGIARHFGGAVPKNHGLFVSHNTVAALNSTASTHVLDRTGVYMTAV